MKPEDFVFIGWFRCSKKGHMLILSASTVLFCVVENNLRAVVTLYF